MQMFQNLSPGPFPAVFGMNRQAEGRDGKTLIPAAQHSVTPQIDAQKCSAKVVLAGCRANLLGGG